MKLALSPQNPRGYSRAGYAWEKVPPAGRSHLDLGCHDGSFLQSLARKGPRRLVGADVALEAVTAGRARYPELELVHLKDPHRLPFPDAGFDSASALDVIEHVADQDRLLGELHRVLMPGGVLIVTVPGRYLLSWLDLGNLKFRLPRLHRRAYCLLRSHERYERRYAAHPDGLVGDVAAAKAWHEHFTPNKLGRLLETAGFEVVEFDGSGFLGRLISVLTLPVSGWPAARKALAPLYRLDARVFSSMNLFCLARKRG